MKDQGSLRRRTFDANNNSYIDNPFDGVEMAKRRFQRYETEDGEEYFCEVGKEESVWRLPLDGELVG